MEQTRSRVHIIEEAASGLSRPNIIVGVPEVGLVGTISASYLIQQLNLPEIAFVDSDLMPQVIVVHESVPKHPVRIYGKGDLAIVIAETPLTPRLSSEFTAELTRWARGKEAKIIIGVTGIPSRKREMSAEDKSNVFVVTNDVRLNERLKQHGTRVFEEGLMVGAYAALLANCMTAGVTSLTLLAESLQQFPDPGAAASVIEVLEKLLDLKVNLKPLLDESEEIRVKSRELMSTTQAVQQGTQKPAGVYT
ncbi:MAG: PAC2 family protein [Thaumarchaeota archaeon]|nr:proteasome assembly chaperone family protein [Nitrososphaerota archaeon]MBI3115738.1 proteasome assembly chaperone family protein [Nitrososphaerota archaeon]MCS4539311.1 PAC2 family protein [Nitrososphaerota archaeon]